MDTPTTPPTEDLLSHTLAFCDDCLNREDYTAAWQALCRAVSMAPNRADVLIHRGRLALFLKDTESARGDFAAALKIDPRSSAAWSGLARYHLQQGEPNEAEGAADRALGIDSADEEAAQLKAELQAERGKAGSRKLSSVNSRATSAEREECVPSAEESPVPGSAGTQGATEIKLLKSTALISCEFQPRIDGPLELVNTHSFRVGCVDRLIWFETDGPAVLRVMGWAVDPSESSRSRAVIITDEQGTHLATTVPQVIRGDVSFALDNPKIGMCGFSIEIPAERIPKQARQIYAYSVRLEDRQAFRICGASSLARETTTFDRHAPVRFSNESPKSRAHNEALNEAEIAQDFVTLRSLPLWVNAEITQKCNLNCRTCFRFDSDFDGGEMELEMFRLIEQELFSTVRMVSFNGGGESPMYSHWDTVVETARHYGFIPQLNSNMTMFKDDRLKALVDAGFELHMSVDTATESTLRFLRTTSMKLVDRRVKLLRDYIRETGNTTFTMVLVFVPSVVNLRELPQVVELAKEWGVTRVVVPPFVNGGAGCGELSPDNVKSLANKMYTEAVKTALKLGVMIQIPELYPLTGKEKQVLEEASRRYPLVPAEPKAAPAPLAREVREAIEADPDISAARSLHTAKDISQTLTAKHRRFCRFPFYQFYVRVNGDVYPCCYGGPLLGSLKYQSPKEIWNGTEWVNLRRSLIEGCPPGACKACPWNV